MENKFTNLRKKAEKYVGKEIVDISKLSHDEIRSLIHNLEVHQVELEMQNTELLTAQQNLQEAHDKYFKLFEFAPVGFLSLDKNLSIKNSNATFSELIQIPKEDIVGHLLTDFIEPDFQDVFHVSYRELLKSKEKQTFELKLKKVAEDELWVNADFIIKDESQTFLISFNDISEKKKADEKLRSNEAKLKAIINNFPNGSINLINKDKQFEMVGGTDYKKFDLNPDDFTNKNLKDVLGPELYDAALEGINKAFRGEVFNYQIGFNETVYKNVVCPVKPENGSIDYVLLINSDITDTINAENALRESEERFKRLAEKARDMIYRMSLPDGKYEYISPSSVDIWGYSPEEVYQNPLLIQKAIHPDWLGYFKEEWEKLIVGEMAPTYEYKIIDKSGKEKWLYQRNVLVKDEKGHPIAIEGIVSDFTNQKLTEFSLKESEERLRYALEGATDGVWDWDVQTNEIYFSPNWKKILGYEDNELGNDFSVWEKLTHPEGVKEAWNILDNYLVGKSNKFKMEFKMLHKKGHWVDVLSRAVAVERDGQGKAIRVVGTHVDISEQKKAQRDLIEAFETSEKRQQEISELLGATHSILKTSDFEESASEIFQACKRSIGAKAGYVALLSEDGHENELLFLDDGGLPCTVDPSLPMPVRGLRAEAYKSGKVVYNNSFMQSEWVKFMPKGHVTLPNVMFAPLNIHGKVVGVLGLSNKDTDFTENDAKLAGAFAEYAAIALLNSQTLENLEKRATELQETNSMKDKLFSIIGHDLRNPLNNITTVAETLKDNYNELPEDKRELATKILYRSANSAATLLENLLQWSRVYQGKMETKIKQLVLKDVIDDCFALNAGNAQTKSISQVNSIECTIRVSADEKMIQTVFRNLISNAIKFTEASGKITATAAEKENEIVVQLKDSGVGMSEELVENLFKLNTKISQKGTAGESGTGLGLIICKEFIEKNKGRIWAESKLGKGSSFFVSLPK